jgi:hypothetical protein
MHRWKNMENNPNADTIIIPIQNSLLVREPKIVLYLAESVNSVNKALNIVERVISHDAIRLSILSPLNFEYTYTSTKNKMIEKGFLVVISVRRIRAKRVKKLFVKIFSLSILTSVY